MPLQNAIFHNILPFHRRHSEGQFEPDPEEDDHTPASGDEGAADLNAPPATSGSDAGSSGLPDVVSDPDWRPPSPVRRRPGPLSRTRPPSASPSASATSSPPPPPPPSAAEVENIVSMYRLVCF
jgi:hypothetical protein